MKIRVGAIQICSSNDYQENLLQIKKYIEEALLLDIKYIFLSECFYSMSDGLTPTKYLVEEGNEHYRNIQSLASENGIYILGGSAATRIDNKIYNRSYNFAPNGDDLGSYDKIHLFSCEFEKEGIKKIINESNLYECGKSSKIIRTDKFSLGLSICFDLRFPDIYQKYFHKSEIISIPSAFTIKSGMAHWHTLVKARAIENQCFVIAAAQWGKHNEKIQTFGHSLIVDPWGTVLADAGEGEGLIHSEIDLSKIEEVRSMIKMV